MSSSSVLAISKYIFSVVLGATCLVSITVITLILTNLQKGKRSPVGILFTLNVGNHVQIGYVQP